MNRSRLLLLLLPALLLAAEPPKLPDIGDAMQRHIAGGEIAGAVTMVVAHDRILHLETTGLADVATARPMTPDAIFVIMSMTKPLTGTAVLMLQDEGKLNLADPVARYIPEFASLKTPSGQPANLTLLQLLTHTSGLGEAGPGARDAKTLADLIPLFLAAPMNYEPGARWRYCQSGINTAARIVEIVSGRPFDEFLVERILRPLGMKDSGHHLTVDQVPRLTTAYARNRETGALEPARTGNPTRRDRPPTGNAGLYSTASDYARFCQMLLNGGELDGRRYLSPAAMKQLASVQTGDLPTGFFQGADRGSRGADYGWGIATSIQRRPHEGVAAMLSPGTYGHGGAWGTQAWIDPVKGVAYILMVQRTNFPNADASDVRRDFQQAAADALNR